MERHSSLVVFATVTVSGILGLLVYAGFFYTNLRLTSSTTEAKNFRPAYPTELKAEQAAKRWIQEGGSFTVTTRKRVRRSIPLTRQERRKLELLADEKRRARIEANYEACLDKASSDLAKELCSFQQTPLDENPMVSETSENSSLPTTKVVENVSVQSSEQLRRQCTPMTSYRRFNCIELDVEKNADLSPDQQNSLAVKSYRQFRY